MPCVRARARWHAAGAINLQFRVENKGWETFDFTCALHTYFAVDDIDSCRVMGLNGARYTSSSSKLSSLQSGVGIYICCAICALMTPGGMVW